MHDLRGQLIVSGGALFDPNFRHTVVLIGQHNAEGALGVILNRPSDLTVEQAIPALAELVAPGERLFLGGPVRPGSPVLVAEVSRPELADLPIFGAIGFLVGDVSEAARDAILRARVYAGYAGWGAGQLEAELEEGSWILEPARTEDVFAEHPESLWSDVLQRKGGSYRRLSRMPFDPTVN